MQSYSIYRITQSRTSRVSRLLVHNLQAENIKHSGNSRAGPVLSVTETWTGQLYPASSMHRITRSTRSHACSCTICRRRTSGTAGTWSSTAVLSIAEA